MGLIIDSFAGGGGASTGIEIALGRSPDIAINHDAEAIAMHMANHPQTKHYIEDIWQVDPVKVCQGQDVDFMWLSPDCTHFSKAKGGAPKSNKIRGLAWIAVRWAKAVRPKVIILENVEEFKTWGPLDSEGQPVKSQQGQTFDLFIESLRELGYKVDFRELRACDYGTPTIRKRFFLVARCDAQPITWPKKTHGHGTYRTAAECIDWTIPVPSIFDRPKPLAEATLRRIARGVVKYVINNPKPYIAPTGHGQTSAATLVQTGYGERAGQKPRALDICKPLGTVVAGASKHALVSVFLTQYHGEQSAREVRGQVIDEPIMVVDAANRYGLVQAHFVAIHFSGVTGSSLDVPLGTVTAIDHNALVACSLMRQIGTSSAAPIGQPVGTIMPGGCGGKTGLIAAFLTKYYGNEKDGCSLTEPLHTVTAKDRLGLVTVSISGEPYILTDIGMRMLQPRELLRAQGFPDDYIIDPVFNGKPLSKKAQVRMAGNSVCPPIAAALVKANYPALLCAEVAS